MTMVTHEVIVQRMTRQNPSLVRCVCSSVDIRPKRISQLERLAKYWKILSSHGRRNSFAGQQYQTRQQAYLSTAMTITDSTARLKAHQHTAQSASAMFMPLCWCDVRCISMAWDRQVLPYVCEKFLETRQPGATVHTVLGCDTSTHRTGVPKLHRLPSIS